MDILRRILTVVSGAGMDLVHPGGALRAALFEPVEFDGGLAVSSRLLDGPLTDFNLMFDPALCDGAARVRRGPEQGAVIPQPSGLTALHVLSGRPRMDGQALATADTVFTAVPADLALAEGDAVLEITLRYLDQSDAIKLAIAAR
ncbi:HutD family protein [Halomonas sp.]|uniref:HutD family protein n=1 Tax=Halomonas sp. TaxID=1486246 RepID=UPI0035618F2D